jgi:hypothetical protein
MAQPEEQWNRIFNFLRNKMHTVLSIHLCKAGWLQRFAVRHLAITDRDICYEKMGIKFTIHNPFYSIWGGHHFYTSSTLLGDSTTLIYSYIQSAQMISISRSNMPLS